MLDFNPNTCFDEIVQLARLLFSSQIGFVSLTEKGQIWLARHPAMPAASPCILSGSLFCKVSVDGDETLVVVDASQDPRFSADASVTGMPHVRFCVAAPLATSDGTRLGTLFVFDTIPHAPVSREMITAFESLARLAVSDVERRNAQVSAAQAMSQAQCAQAMLVAIAGASTCEMLLQSTLRVLCQHYGATSGHAFRYDTLAHRAETVANFGDGRTSHAKADDATLLDALIATEPHSVAQGWAKGQSGVQNGPADARIAPSIIVPIFAGAERFALAMVFASRNHDIGAIGHALAAFAQNIRPHLERHIIASKAELLTKALDCATDGVLITNAETDRPGPMIVYANASMERLTGYSSDEMIGQTPRMLQGAGSDRITLDHMRTSLESCTAGRFEIENYRKDGSCFRSEIDITPVSDAGSNHRHFVSIQRDITERHKTAKADQDRERLNRSLFNRSPAPMWITEIATLRFLEVNEAASEHYGWTREQFLKMSLFDIRDGTLQQILTEKSKDGDNSNAIGRIWKHVKADGRQIFVRGSAHHIVYGGKDAWMSVLWDVTDMEISQRQQAISHQQMTELASSLKRHAEELTEIQKLAKLGTWRSVAGTESITWSDEMYQMMGRSKLDFRPTAESTRNCIHPDDRQRASDTFQRVLQTGTLELADLRIVRPDDSVLYTRWNARQYSGEDGQIAGIYGYCQDITELKRNEDALHRSEKLKALGQLTGGIAHDFNNLLTVITLNLEDAVETLPETDPIQGMLQSALEAAERAANLTAQLLSYSRRDVLRPKPIEIAAFLENLRPELMRALQDDHRLRISVASDTPRLVADPARLESALLNLVINARDAMPQGGVIELSASLATLGHNNFDHPSEISAGGYVVISVADSGAGIAPDKLVKVFEPFFTTRELGEARGLGLSMVYGFAKQSGGHVTLDSLEGLGTTARLYLPRHIEEAPAKAAAKIGSDGVTAKPLRVLVVEDQLIVLNSVTRVLEAVGFEVIRTGSSAQARRALASLPAFDLLFADIILPGPENGIAIAQHAKKTAPGIRVLLTTGFPEYDAHSTEIAALDAKFLLKPYKRTALYALLRTIFPQSQIGDDTDFSVSFS